MTRPELPALPRRRQTASAPRVAAVSRRVSALLCALAALAAGAAATSLAQDAEIEGGMMAGGASGILHDPVVFREQVLPTLELACGGCHAADDPANESRYRIITPDAQGNFTDDAVEANYKSVIGVLNGREPERSRMLLKLVPMRGGGIDHDGGKADGESFAKRLIHAEGPLASWIFGATRGSTPPIAVHAPMPRTTEVGATVQLDGRLSFDKDTGDGEKLTYKWEIVEAPLGSRARIDEPRARTTSLTPDRPGPWLLRLRVSDGRLAAWPALMRFTSEPKRAAGSVTGGQGNDFGTTTLANITTHERRRTRALYLDLIGRTPTEEELGRLVALDYEDRIDLMLGDVATWKQWFDEESFYFLLIDRFRPVSDRMANVAKQMADGTIDFHGAHTAFALSAEFNARNPGNDTYVTVVLEQFLGIEVQSEKRLLAAAKKMYDGSVARIFKQKGNSQSDVVRIALQQPDYASMFMRRMEERYLGEALPEKEHEEYLALITGDRKRFKMVLREWLLSMRYAGKNRGPRPKTDHQFIKSLFVDLLGRAPAYEEFRNMRNALQSLSDPAPLRGVLARVMLDSGAVVPPAADPTTDAPAVVRELFHRFLGRDPLQKEMTAFANELSYGGGSWRPLALALLNSPHYPYY